MRKPSNWRTRLMVVGVVGTAAVSLAAGASSMAFFTSTATVPANTFSTGTVIISTSPSTALVTFANMAPGDAVTAPLTVTNGGTLALRYAVSSVATNTDTKSLKDQLVLTVKSGVTTCTNAGFATDGTSDYTGDLDSTAGKIIGDSATGSQAGDRVLPPTTSNTEVLCFHVSLPTTTDNNFQGATTTATFTFAAEQTANN